MKYRVIRGACWSYVADYFSSSERHWYEPSLRNYYLGFRIAQRKPKSRIESRVLRGNSWSHMLIKQNDVRADIRGGSLTTDLGNFAGFRIAQKKSKP